MISNSDKLACLVRELRMRERVYPRWIAEGRMSETKARFEIDVINAIIADYRALDEKDRLL